MADNDSKQMTATDQTAEPSRTGQSSNAATKKRLSSGVDDLDHKQTTKSKRKITLQNMTYPRRQSLPCIIRVAKNPPMGLDDETVQDDMTPLLIYLDIDRGRNGSPQISLEFIEKDDLDEPLGPYAYVNWAIDDIIGGRWLMEDLTIQSVAKCPNNKGVNDPAVVDNFRESDGRVPENITCMTIHVDYCQSKNIFWDDEMECVEEVDMPTMEALFKCCKPYKIRIWFAIPFNFPQMESQCLEVLRTLFRDRVLPLSKVED